MGMAKRVREVLARVAVVQHARTILQHVLQVYIVRRMGFAMRTAASKERSFVTMDWYASAMGIVWITGHLMTMGVCAGT
jgi:uncharacterized membrane protein AbrB (regulator of aidB expression)